jgi:hypothetical protein
MSLQRSLLGQLEVPIVIQSLSGAIVHCAYK